MSIYFIDVQEKKLVSVGGGGTREAGGRGADAGERRSTLPTDGRLARAGDAPRVTASAIVVGVAERVFVRAPFHGPRLWLPLVVALGFRVPLVLDVEVEGAPVLVVAEAAARAAGGARHEVLLERAPLRDHVAPVLVAAGVPVPERIVGPRVPWFLVVADLCGN